MKHARSDYDQIQDPSGKIPIEEPVFLLRAQDSLAPAIVEEWAKRLKKLLGDSKMTQLAEDQASKMRDWQSKYGSKFPDLPNTFLHNHPELEKDLGLDQDDQVIVDRKDWERAIEICHKRVF